ncbi:MAG: hypothetical protein IPI87_15800 [Betaproteobacteria bacterium]|nr:hypothetical protein [Betaproteobacteria bacterium]
MLYWAVVAATSQSWLWPATIVWVIEIVPPDVSMPTPSPSTSLSVTVTASSVIADVRRRSRRRCR